MGVALNPMARLVRVSIETKRRKDHISKCISAFYDNGLQILNTKYLSPKKDILYFQSRDITPSVRFRFNTGILMFHSVFNAEGLESVEALLKGAKVITGIDNIRSLIKNPQVRF